MIPFVVLAPIGGLRQAEILAAIVEARRAGVPRPSNHALALDLGVSRRTVRSHVDTLVRAGWLRREWHPTAHAPVARVELSEAALARLDGREVRA